MFKSLIDVENTGELSFQSINHRENFRQTIFGGQVLAQALMAAIKTVDGRPPHSFHAYFLRAGSSNSPIDYRVEKIRDGRSVSSRRVDAYQDGKIIFNLAASFHELESGFNHAETMPHGIPQPEELIDASSTPSHAPEHGDKDTEASPFHIVPLPEELFTSSELHEPEALFWVKTIAPIPDQAAFHVATLAFASDLGLLATAVLPHPTTLFSSDIFAASIDHAMWLHTQDFKATDWMLFSIKSPWAGGARGFSQAKIFDRAGRIIAHTSQEGLIRPLTN